jgi:hypothetical protein
VKRLVWLAALVIPSLAHAGIDLTWDDCVGSGSDHYNKTFVCTGTVNQMYRLPLYFKVPESLPGFVGIRMDLDFESESNAPLSPFWHFEQGGCQRPGGTAPNGISVSDNKAAGPAGCQLFADPWGEDGSQGFEGIAAYLTDYRRPGQGRFILGVASSASYALDTGVNYYACHMIFTNRYRNACAGCADRGAIRWDSAVLESNDGHPPIIIAFPEKVSDCVLVNNGDPILCGIDPVRSVSWGRVKSLYR